MSTFEQAYEQARKKACQWCAEEVLSYQAEGGDDTEGTFHLIHEPIDDPECTAPTREAFAEADHAARVAAEERAEALEKQLSGELYLQLRTDLATEKRTISELELLFTFFSDETLVQKARHALMDLQKVTDLLGVANDKLKTEKAARERAEQRIEALRAARQKLWEMITQSEMQCGFMDEHGGCDLPEHCLYHSMLRLVADDAAKEGK